MSEVTTDITTLPPADRALIVLNSTNTEIALLDLVANAKLITDVIDPNGREQAHRMGMSLRRARTAIEKTGKTARDDATAFCKAVIGEEKRLIAITEPEEKRVLGLRDAFDEKLEAERRAIEARRAEVQKQIDGIRALPMALVGASADEIDAEHNALVSFIPAEEVFGDLLAECLVAKDECLAALLELSAKARAREEAIAAQEAARRQADEALAAERAELDAERAAIAKERAELEALRAAAMPAIANEQAKPASAAQPGAEIEPVEVPEDLGDLKMPEEAFIQAPPPPVDWQTRVFALHTSDQFDAMATKVNQCGFGAFAETLRAVAQALRDGAHDVAIDAADKEALLSADALLLDATAACIEAFSGEAK
jgi:hypothetical protein